MPDQKKILIVEDEKLMAIALECKLADAGFSTSIAYDGEAALNAVRKENFDLIILDLLLPKMDGFEFLEAVLASKNKTPVVVLSNLGQEEHIARGKALGVVGYFVKTDITLSGFINYVKNFLENQNNG